MTHWLTAERPTDGPDGSLVPFAAQHSDQPVVLPLLLQKEGAGESPPELQLQTEASGCGMTITSAGPDCFHVCLTVPAAESPIDDDELLFVVRSAGRVVRAAGDRQQQCQVGGLRVQMQQHVADVRPRFQATPLCFGQNGAQDRAARACLCAVREQRIAAFDLPVPRIPQPDSVDFIGRQWTGEGPDYATGTTAAE